MRNFKSNDFGSYGETDRMRLGNIKKLLIFWVFLLCFTFMFSVFIYTDEKIEKRDTMNNIKIPEDK